HPAMLDDLGLIAALRQHAEQWKRSTAVDITVSEEGHPSDLSSEYRHVLYRAIRELLKNATRHGNANAIVVLLHWSQRTLRVVVDDDGNGFDAEKVMNALPAHGLGLASIRERVDGLGGRLEIESRL